LSDKQAKGGGDSVGGTEVTWSKIVNGAFPGSYCLGKRLMANN
jgi:hypothetical protein